MKDKKPLKFEAKFTATIQEFQDFLDSFKNYGVKVGDTVTFQPKDSGSKVVITIVKNKK